ncbi:replication initiator [Streptomyces sp. NPDC051018]|uniref:replication initiator n=1 Tax=Streptomyces sp. NPDC051018 TaxID=3365639 RepID=UPI00378DE771
MNRTPRRPGPSVPGRLPLSDTERDLVRLAQDPGFTRWLEQIRSTGGCSHPVYLAGYTTTIQIHTGAILRHFTTETEPNGRLAVRCRNRRESVCEPCSRLHSGDTFHLVRSGLQGGKGTPQTVASHPRLFLTLTAPSFGPVHRVSDHTARCRPRRDGGVCEHDRPLGCGLVHTESDRAAGQPLCPVCYDYCGHVLWHAHAGELWSRTVRTIRRRLATTGEIPQSCVSAHVRLSFAKVAEYQRRGAVHVHSVIRLDGPDGPGSPPPSWATPGVLTNAVRAAVASAEVPMAYSPALGEQVFRWGRQIDVHPIRTGSGGDTPVTDQAVAAYVAKYVSKSVGDTGGTDHPVSSLDAIDLLPASPHIRALMARCWRLGSLPALEHLRLREWAHTLGYRGHVLTKSRHYSTTYAQLRADRAAHLAGQAGTIPLDTAPGTVTERDWRYVGSGHTPGAAEIAAGIAADLATLRDIQREIRITGGPDG